MKYFLIWLWTGYCLYAGITVPPGMEAEFRQKVTNPRQKVIRYAGRVVMDDQNRFRWSYTRPTRKEVCGDGKRVVVVDHDLEQVSFYRMKEGFDLGAVLRRARHYRGKLYTATYQDRTYTLEVDERGMVDQIAYRDDMDNVVHIRLLRIKKLSRPPSPAKLRCAYPQDYDRLGG